jgi:pimeloyl-ACP methyl ester carboxylesterase
MHIDSGGVDIHVEVTGAGRPVVLLHGFPDSGRLWRNQVAALSAAGFMVIVPDLRGYGDSAKPASVEEYSMLFLAGDVLAILDHLGVDRAHLVGHDWGSALVWTMASLAPDRVDHLVALSVGHPAAFRAVGFEQLEKSWYMFFFQFEDVAERWLSDDSWANLRAWTNHPDIDAAIAELGENGSLTPALNWYRVNIPPQAWVDPPLDLPPVQAPTMGCGARVTSP